MTVLRDEWNVKAEDNSNISLTSLNLTIVLTFVGLIWSITSYIFNTKWKCSNDQTIWESQLLPLLKPIWEKYGYPIYYRICCAVCIQAKKTDDTTAINRSDRTSSYYSSTPVSGVNHTRSVNSGHSTSMNGYESADGYQSLDGRNVEERAIDDDNIHSPDLTTSENSHTDCEQGLPEGEVETRKKPLFGSKAVILMFSLTQILARPFIIAANIVYIALNYSKDINNSLDEPGGYNLSAFTDYMMYQETVSLIIGPFTNAIYWVCCWRQCRTNNSCRKFMEFMRFADLQVVVLVAPYANTHLYALGGWWYLVLIVRLLFYAITFAAAVVAGMRFVCACYCKVFFTCGCDNDVLEIRDMKHLLFEIGFKLIPIFLKINTSSSAIATFIKLGTKGGPSFQFAYFFFSLIRSITSLFSLGFSGAMLRWALLKKEHKWEDRSWLTKVLRFLNKYEPHIHFSFFFDVVTYFSLLVLNLILLELISENGFYCNNNCPQS